MQTKWSLRDIILLALIGLFFGLIFWGWAFVANIITAALTPLGLSVFAGQITIGTWVMAGPMAGFLLRRAGASVLGEVLAGTAEMFFGSQWGIMDVVYGFMQGIGSELGFAHRLQTVGQIQLVLVHPYNDRSDVWF